MRHRKYPTRTRRVQTPSAWALRDLALAETMALLRRAREQRAANDDDARPTSCHIEEVDR